MSAQLPPDSSAPRSASIMNRIVASSLAPAVSHRPDDAGAHRRRVSLAGPPAGGRLSRSVAAHGRDHHPMARPRRRGSGAADHRAGREGDERHSADDHDPLDLAVRLVRRHPHLSKRHGQLFRPPASLQPHGRSQPAERRDPLGVAAVLALGPDLPLCAAKPRPLADGTQDLRGLDRRAAVQIRSRRGG